jgi:hypothetical protein
MTQERVADQAILCVRVETADVWLAVELAFLIAEMSKIERVAGKQLRMAGGRSEGRAHVASI